MEICIKTWQEAQSDAYSVRQKVFIEEQGVPEDLEVDEFDAIASHALLFKDLQCIGTGRLVKLGEGQFQIGRMAILSSHRGMGLGRQILESLITLANAQKAHSILLHSQVSAIPFYEKLGFKAEGPIYDEAGISHRNMILVLS